MNEAQQLAKQALEQMKSDDLYRAKASFKGMSSQQMNEQHGQSGKTRQQILDGYEKQNARIDAAISWVVSS